jgi:hypothetical protein
MTSTAELLSEYLRRGGLLGEKMRVKRVKRVKRLSEERTNNESSEASDQVKEGQEW